MMIKKEEGNEGTGVQQTQNNIFNTSMMSVDIFFHVVRIWWAFDGYGIFVDMIRSGLSAEGVSLEHGGPEPHTWGGAGAAQMSGVDRAKDEN